MACEVPDAKIEYSAAPRKHGAKQFARIAPDHAPSINLATQQVNDHIRYEPDEHCPLVVSFIASFQGVLLVLTPMVTAVTTTALVAGQSEEYLIWSAFAAFLICGLITALQAGRVWRFGTGHALLTAASVSLIVVSVPALLAGGPGLLAAVLGGGCNFTICPLVVAAVAPKDHHSGGNGHGPDVAGRYRDSYSRRQGDCPAERCRIIFGAGGRRGDPDSAGGAGTESIGSVAALGAANRHWSGVRGVSPFRTVRLQTGDGGPVGGHPRNVVPRFRNPASVCLLCAAADGDHSGDDQWDQEYG